MSDENEMNTVVVAYTEPEGVDLLQARLVDSLHLRPMWEKLRTGDHNGRTFLGIPIGSKVTSDTVQNHGRHLHSLLRLLDLPLTSSPEQVEAIEVPLDSLSELEVPDVED
mgnify:FL=1